MKIKNHMTFAAGKGVSISILQKASSARNQPKPLAL
jgi:hypothetical protein